MKAPIVENWSDIAGEIKAVRPHPELAEFVAAAITLGDAHAVPAFAHLLEGCAGQTISVNIPQELGHRLGLKPGVTFRGRVRRGGNAYFVHPEHAALIPPGSTVI